MKKLLNKFPRLKEIVKIVYEYLWYFYTKKKYRIKINSKILKISYNNEESFFGYYDKSPLNGNKVLFYSTTNNTKNSPRPGSPIDICIYDIKTKDVIKLASTTTYNWQQGARCQWISDTQFIFNNFIDNEYKTCLYNINTKKIETIYNKAVQDSFKNKYFLSLNYRRLAALRPDYGYFNLEKLNNKELQEIENDGIWFIDYNSKQEELILSINDVLSCDYHEKFSNAIHKLNHVLISPDGKNFIFMHRYFIDGVKTDRLFLYDFENGLKLLSNYGMVSHYNWMSNNEIIGYMKGPTGNKYYKLNIENCDFQELNDDKLVGLGDGHPTCYMNEFITDSYPNKSRIQTLLKFNFNNGSSTTIGEFFHSINYRNESRCDLHPRFVDNKVFFDSVYTGKRQLYMIELNK
jgi:hypothetical protein